MSLSKTQQVKIRAALAFVRDKHGPGDVQQLIAMAKQMKAQGAPERAAWNFAMDQLHRADPELSAKIAQSFNLLDASDDATITRYDGALTNYLDNGDQSELLAMRPDIARDDANLDFRNGVISKQELDARLAEIEADRPEQQPQPNGNGEQSAVPQLGEAPTPVNATNSSQVSLGGGPTGMVAPRVAQLWARDPAVREEVAAQAEGPQSL